MSIDIAFCVSDTYIPFITVCINSILINNPNDSVNLYILVDSASAKSVKRLDEVVKSHSLARYILIPVHDKRISGLRTNKVHESIWYRILLPDYLPNSLHRVLYLDADTLVVGSLHGLFGMDFSNCAIAGCLDPLSFKPETFTRLDYDRSLGYICAGVMMVNLDCWRKTNLIEKLIRYAKEFDATIPFKDQDVINYVCRNNKLILPLKYGIMDCYLSGDWPYKESYSEELKECKIHPAIIHFAGNAPWKKEFSHRLYHDEWQKYNRQLDHPVRRRYATKGWLFVKMIIWNFVHN